jgi:DNA-binding CsgD family transcriptional regulator
MGRMSLEKPLSQAPLAVPPRLCSLLRALATEAGQVPMPARGATRDAAGRDVIVDVELDGYRYVLARSPAATVRSQAVLSSRELEIARMIAAGHTNKTVARVLDISSWTASTHMRRIFAKLGVGSRAAMVARLLEDGMLGEPLDGCEAPLGRRRP